MIKNLKIKINTIPREIRFFWKLAIYRAHLKFGCISIREVYHKIKKLYSLQNSLLDQLFWREFYFYIIHYFPQVLKGKNYNPKYDKLKWTVNKRNFEKWCQGETGFPVVDAGMKQLNETGYMHNRASFNYI